MRRYDLGSWLVAIAICGYAVSTQAQERPEPRGATPPAAAAEASPSAEPGEGASDTDEGDGEASDDERETPAFGEREYRLRDPDMSRGGMGAGAGRRFGPGTRGAGMRGEGMRGEGARGPWTRGPWTRGEDMRGEGMRGPGMHDGAGMRGGRCGERAFEAANGSVVRVESGTSVGSGFVVIDPSHVVTAFRIVREGHDVRVVDVEGNARSARVISTAPDDDLALLELASPLGAEPLELAPPDSLRVGMPIVALGHPYVSGRDRLSLGMRGEGLFSQSLSSGVVSAVGVRSLSTDAQLASGSVGGPLLDCMGRVAGAVSVARIGQNERIFVAASSLAIDDLASRAEDPQSYSGRVRFTFGLGLSTAFEDPGWPMGVYGLVGLNVYDAFVLAGRLHYLEAGSEPTGSDVLHVYDQRYRGDAFVAWRQLVSFGRGMGFTFELGAGASVTNLQQHRRVGRIDSSSGEATLRVDVEALERWAVRPMLVLNVELGPVAIGYDVELDIDTDHDRYHVQHVFSLGARF